MTFRYFKKTGELYDKHGEWDGDDGFEFEYDVDIDDIEKALFELVNDYYFDGKLDRKNFANFMRDFDMTDMLIDGFEDELQDYFEQEALDSLD